jgi:hypothetical protein
MRLYQRPTASRVRSKTRSHAGRQRREGTSKEGEEHRVLKSLTDVRRWRGTQVLVLGRPEQSQRNYAQVLIEVFDKHDTNHLVDDFRRS